MRLSRWLGICATTLLFTHLKKQGDVTELNVSIVAGPSGKPSYVVRPRHLDLASARLQECMVRSAASALRGYKRQIHALLRVHW